MLLGVSRLYSSIGLKASCGDRVQPMDTKSQGKHPLSYSIYRENYVCTDAYAEGMRPRWERSFALVVLQAKVYNGENVGPLFG